MPIDVVCSCGKKFRADDHHAGRTFDCPVCGQSLTVPYSTTIPDLETEKPPSSPRDADDSASIMPGSFWQPIVDGLSALLPSDKLISLSRLAGIAGLHCMTALMVLIPLLLIIIAIKTDSLSVALMAVAIAAGLSLAQYLNERLLKVISRQLHASPVSTTSSVLFDVIGLACIISAIGVFLFSGYTAIQFSQWEAFLLGVPGSIFLVACGFVALNPAFLGIKVDPEATSADDILTIVSLPFKLLLAMTPFVFLSFGLAILTQTIFAFAAVLATDESVYFVLSATSALLTTQAGYLGLVPLASYLMAALGLFIISVSAAILAIPRKLDEIHVTLDD
jgi:hypothetical protein